MQIAVLGGSFDPPHLGHTLLADQISKHFPIDEVWLMPCYQHPFNKQLSPAKHRLAMTMMLETDKLKVSTVEIQKQNMSYSIDTLTLLQKTFPAHSFLWIIGSDQIKDFPKWKNWQKIIREFGLLVYPRDIAVATIPDLLKKSLHLPTIPPTILYPEKPLQTFPISSTQIRELIKQKQAITDLVTPKVAAYIIKQKLYE
jgi:nicotinate-nucleotide adenylyltransferase